MEDVIRRLYQGLKDRDAGAIAACYHREATFQDPVFGLAGAEVPAMWRMLVEAGNDLRVSWRDIRSQGQDGNGTGRGHWEAEYTFSATGRKVRNRIDSEFRFRDGLIVAQRDRFAFWRWSRMALGTPGLLLGWTPLLRAKVRARARANLDRFLAAHPEYR